MNRLGVRRRLFLVVVATLAVAIAALVAGFNTILGRTLDRDARDLARARATTELGLLTASNGRLTVKEAPDDAATDPYVWVFSAGAAVEQPRVGGRVDAAARGLTGGPAGFVDVPAADARLYAVPAVVHGRRLGTVVAGVSLAPYEETRRLALLGSLAFGAIVLIVVAVAARWLLGSSLRPVRRMTRQAAAWSEYDLDQRFGLGDPHDELTELAATLDQLLDRLATSLRREQRFSAEVSHELRTPLARIMAESELATRRPRTSAEYRAALELTHKNAAQLTRTIDVFIAAARHEAGHDSGTADAFDVAAEAAAGCAELASARALDVKVKPPVAPIRVGIDAELAVRILQPLLDNACRHGARAVDVRIDRANGAVRYTIDDDGPGVAAGERERIFEPGIRGGAAASTSDGAGLGLALARRLARSVSGEVVAAERQDGARFIVTLPRG
jgi:signal transduction histidine kinase